MSDPFDWQTEEDGWETPIVPQVETAVSRKSRWPIFLVIIIALGALWGVAQRQVREGVQAATANVETDVIAAHNFFRQTAVNNDQDLLKPLLSARDPRWAEAQESLIDTGIVMDRPMFGWQLQNDADPLLTDAITISLNNHFDEAVLQIEHNYAFQAPSGITETVTLVQTAVYRKGQTRWLYSPPLDSFWGGWHTHEGQRLTLVYPERDATWGKQLAVDLDALIAEVCQLDGLSCPDDLHLHLRLDKSPQSLLALTNPNYALTNTLRLDLPTPTLVGVPVDEAGYAVLYRAYGEPAATAVITHLVNYNCCRWSRVYKALLDVQLAELGLKHVEMYAETYETLFAGDRLPTLATIFNNVRVNTTASEQHFNISVHTLVSFITETAAPNRTIADMQRTLLDSNTPQKWIDTNVAAAYQSNQFLPQFWQYMYNHSTSGQLTDLPIPLPSETMEMVCENLGEGPRAFLVAYDWQTAEWRQVYEHQWNSNGFGHITPLWSGSATIPGAYAAMSFGFSSVGEQTDTKAVIIQDGVEQLSIVTENPYAVANLIDPTLRYMVMYDYPLNGNLQSVSLMDLQSCDAGQCESWPLTGWPHWSPDGQNMLVDDSGQLLGNRTADFSQSTIYMADARGQAAVAIGPGIAPFWIDDTWYGYVQTDEDGEDIGLVLVNRTTDKQVVLATTADLLAAVPASERPEELFWQYRIYPQDDQGPYRLIVEVNDDPDFNGRSYLFGLQWPESSPQASQIDLIHRSDSRSIAFSSLNGDWLTLFGWNNSGIINAIQIMNLQDGRIERIETNSWTSSWSPDSNWLVYGRDNRLILYAPDYGVRKLVFHSYETCNNIVWRSR